MVCSKGLAVCQSFLCPQKYTPMIDFSRFNSIFELTAFFCTEERCKRAIRDSRWEKDDIVCPFCGKHHCYTRKDGAYRCPECGKNFSVTVGTIFENTKISLRKWFIAMYLISSHKKGVSSHQLSRDLGITQKTAWFILHKVRTLYQQYDTPVLEGEVEADEMYLGGREINKHDSKRTKGTRGRSTKTKTPIFGMAERDGSVRAMKVENTKSKTLMPIIKQFVAEGSSVFTDESNIYTYLPENGYSHGVVQHNIRQYSRGGVTTNTIEGFWAYFKRIVFGTYHFVSKEYLQRYIDEAVYRYNTRKADETARFTYMFRMAIGKCSYEDVKMGA